MGWRPSAVCSHPAASSSRSKCLGDALRKFSHGLVRSGRLLTFGCVERPLQKIGNPSLMAEEQTPPPQPAAPAQPAAAKPAAAPSKPEAVDASHHPWVESIRAAVPDAVLSAKEFAKQVTVVVAREKIADVARHLKDGEDFRYCVDVTAVDWRDRQPRFDVVYHFYSFSKNDRIRVKCGVADGEEVPSIARVFLAANWPERETWDMFGIRFAGHPDLRRILTWEGFNGYPLRKDFPVEGIDTGAAVYPEEWPEGGGPAQDDPNRKVVS